MLITPAATALLLFDNLKRVILYSALIGMVAAVTGFLVAVMFGTTPGPAMTLTATLFYLLAAFLSPSKGLIIRYLDRRKQVNRIVNEDVLRQMIKKPNSVISADKLSNKLGVSVRRIKRAISKLGQLKLIEVNGDDNRLTDLGKKAANRLVRAHRLWETYQVNKMGLSAHEIHEEADYLEHLLSDEILEELDKDLGFPETDPHGSPIPAKTKQ
jgi:Mn-dependent DtxR family transcriptional regulator